MATFDDYYEQTDEAYRIEGNTETEWIEGDALDLRCDTTRLEGETPTEWIEVDDDIITLVIA